MKISETAIQRCFSNTNTISKKSTKKSFKILVKKVIFSKIAESKPATLLKNELRDSFF